MNVDIEEVIAIKKRLREINVGVNFDSIVWHKDGKPYEFSDEELSAKENWKFIGLNNADFVWDCLCVDISGNHNKYASLHFTKGATEGKIDVEQNNHS